MRTATVQTNSSGAFANPPLPHPYSHISQTVAHTAFLSKSKMFSGRASERKVGEGRGREKRRRERIEEFLKRKGRKKEGNTKVQSLSSFLSPSTFYKDFSNH